VNPPRAVVAPEMVEAVCVVHAKRRESKQHGEFLSLVAPRKGPARARRRLQPRQKACLESFAGVAAALFLPLATSNAYPPDSPRSQVTTFAFARLDRAASSGRPNRDGYTFQCQSTQVAAHGSEPAPQHRVIGVPATKIGPRPRSNQPPGLASGVLVLLR
jgi:hypothetical protein